MAPRNSIPIPPVPPGILDALGDGHAACVYFAHDPQTGLIKIGTTWALGLMKRIRELDRVAGHPLTLLAAMPGDSKVEHAIHAELKTTRVFGEWFLPSERLSEIIAAATPYVPVPPPVMLLGPPPPPPPAADACVNGHPWPAEATRLQDGPPTCVPCAEESIRRHFARKTAEGARHVAAARERAAWSPDAAAYWHEWAGLL